MADHETRLERQRRLADRLAESAIDAMLSGHGVPYGFEVLAYEDGQEFGLTDDEVAIRSVDTGEVWTVEVGVTCVPVAVDRG